MMNDYVQGYLNICTEWCKLMRTYYAICVYLK